MKTEVKSSCQTDLDSFLEEIEAAKEAIREASLSNRKSLPVNMDLDKLLEIFEDERNEHLDDMPEHGQVSELLCRVEDKLLSLLPKSAAALLREYSDLHVEEQGIEEDIILHVAAKTALGWLDDTHDRQEMPAPADAPASGREVRILADFTSIPKDVIGLIQIEGQRRCLIFRSDMPQWFRSQIEKELLAGDYTETKFLLTGELDRVAQALM